MANDPIYAVKLSAHLFNCGEPGDQNHLNDPNYLNELNGRIHLERLNERE